VKEKKWEVFSVLNCIGQISSVLWRYMDAYRITGNQSR